MAQFHNNALIGSSGATADYEIEKSVRLNKADSATFQRSVGDSDERDKWSCSFWFRTADIGIQSDSQEMNILKVQAANDNDGYMNLGFVNRRLQIGNWSNCLRRIGRLWRDPTGWGHALVVFDSHNATEADRCIFYINGVRETNYAYSTSITQYLNGVFMTNGHTVYIGGGHTGSQYYNGYLAEMHFLDNIVASPTDFGKFHADHGEWVPIEYTGSHGSQGFYLDFKNNSTADNLGLDASANSNNWTANNISVAAGENNNDSFTDTPTNTRCLVYTPDLSNEITITNGSIEMSTSGVGNFDPPTHMVESGKWYWEEKCQDSANAIGVSICSHQDTKYTEGPWSDDNNTGSYYYWLGGSFQHDDTENTAPDSATTNDIIQVALDLDNNKLFFGKNNTWQSNGTGAGNPVTGANPVYTLTDRLWYGPCWSDGSSSSNAVYDIRQGGNVDFTYDPPTGYNAGINTSNMPVPAIKNPKKYFDIVTWTGNGDQTRSFTDLEFQPDLVTIRPGNDGGDQPWFFWDSTRGTGATKSLQYPGNEEQGGVAGGWGAMAANGFLTSFDSNGFSVEDGTATNGGYVNYNNRTYNAWCWKKSAASGFDIQTWTGNETVRTISHDLGAKPHFILFRKYSGGTSRYWWVYWHTKGATHRWQLDDHDTAFVDAADFMNDTEPTSSVFTLGAGEDANKDGDEFIAYLFTSVPGFSQFGTYIGNGSSYKGPFVHCGFKPAWVYIQNTDSGRHGHIYTRTGSTRSALETTGNPKNFNELVSGSYASRKDGTADDAGHQLDFQAQGFFVQTNGNLQNDINGSGHTIMYAAFAEVPGKYARGN